MTAFANAPIQYVILGLLIPIVTALAGMGVAWLKGRADNTRAGNEGQIILNSEAARQFKEFRTEVHAYKNQVAVLLAAQRASDRKYAELEKLLVHALATSSMRRDQMNNMMSLIELLIAEVERIDPKSIIVPQAKALLKQMRDVAASAQEPSTHRDPDKSLAMNAADSTVHDTAQAAASALDSREELQRSEDDLS